MDRALVAFAFLAQASRTEGDLLSGLAPLFRPLAKALAGQRFEGSEFTAEVAKRYGIKVNSWAVEDFAPRLEAAGVLQKVQLSPDATSITMRRYRRTFQKSRNPMSRGLLRSSRPSQVLFSRNTS